MVTVLFVILTTLVLTVSTCSGNLLRDHSPTRRNLKTGESLPTIDDIILNDSDLTTLANALSSAELLGTFCTDCNFTVFAPTNDAFSAINETILASYLKPERVVHLANLLSFHITEPTPDGMRVLQSDYVDGDVFPMLNSENVTVNVRAQEIVLVSNTGSSSPIVASDVLASNGVVNKVGSVFLPQFLETNAFTLGEMYPDISLFGELIEMAGLSNLQGDYTVLAPDNDAWRGLGENRLAELRNDTVALGETLQGHIIEGINPPNTLMDGRILTALSGANVTVGRSLELSSLFQAAQDNQLLQFNNATRTDTIVTANAIVYVINSVLGESSVPTTAAPMGVPFPSIVPAPTPANAPISVPVPTSTDTPVSVPEFLAPFVVPVDIPTAPPITPPSAAPITDTPVSVPEFLAPFVAPVDNIPTALPITAPSAAPITVPTTTLNPTGVPIASPIVTLAPTTAPIVIPTALPITAPMAIPTTTLNPTGVPIAAPIVTSPPTSAPIEAVQPTMPPVTSTPTAAPAVTTVPPTRLPFTIPTLSPATTLNPTISPISVPTPSAIVPSLSPFPCELCDDNNQCTIDVCSTFCPDNDNCEASCDNTPISCEDDDQVCDPMDGICKDVDSIRPCIAVIDESSLSPEVINVLWSSFRSTYPSRLFCLLQPNRTMFDELFLPTMPDFLMDNRTTFATVNRDEGDEGLASDWFTLCGYNNLAATGIDFVGLFVDESGSMTRFTVQASLDKFISDLTSANLTFCSVFNPFEDWITPFDTQLGTIGGGGECNVDVTSVPTSSPIASVPTSPPNNFPVSDSPSALPSFGPTSAPIASVPTSPPNNFPVATSPSALPSFGPTSAPSACDSCDDSNQCTIDVCTILCVDDKDCKQSCDNTPITCDDDQACDPTDGKCKNVDSIRPCIAVIDESDNFLDEEINALWSSFRTKYPDRPFCLLQPNSTASDRLFLPTMPDFIKDGRTIFSYVNRDNGDVNLRSDWFTLCGYNNLTATGIDFVGLFVDESGSMTQDTVQASLDKFILDLTNANLTYCSVFNGSENWITPFDTQLGSIGDDGECNTDGTPVPSSPSLPTSVPSSPSLPMSVPSSP